MDKEALKERFIKATMPNVKTEAQIKKHIHYLHNVALKKYASLYNEVQVNDWLYLHHVEKAFEELYPAIQAVYDEEIAKGIRMVQEGKFMLSTHEGGEIFIQSETNGRGYTIDPKELKCSCPQGKKLSYIGLFCKHIACLYSIVRMVIINTKEDNKKIVGINDIKGIRKLTL